MVLPPVAIVCWVAEVEIKLIVPTAVKVTVAVEAMLSATLPVPAVVVPILTTDVVAAKIIVPVPVTDKERHSTVFAELIVTDAPVGITTSSPAVVAACAPNAAVVQLVDPAAAVIVAMLGARYTTPFARLGIPNKANI